MRPIEHPLDSTLPLWYETVFSLGLRDDGSVCLLGGIAAYDAEGKQVALACGFDCDHRKLEDLAARLYLIQPDPGELLRIISRQLGREPFYRVARCG